MTHYTVSISNMVNLHQKATQKQSDFRKYMRLEVAAETPEAAIRKFLPYLDLGDRFEVTTREDTGRYDREAYPIAYDHVHLGGKRTAVKYHPNQEQLLINRRDDQPVNDDIIPL